MRKKRENEAQEITVTIQITVKKKAQDKHRKAGCHPKAHTLGNPNPIHARIQAPTDPTYTDIPHSETCITGLAEWC